MPRYKPCAKAASARHRHFHSKTSATSIESAKAEQLQRGQDHELRSVNEIPLPETPRFLQQAKKPFQAVFLHPCRRLLLAFCKEVERSANSNHYRNAQTVAMLAHPAILFRSAKANPQDIRSRAVDHVYRCSVFFRRQRTERR